jgi:flagellar assembly protein FliH
MMSLSDKKTGQPKDKDGWKPLDISSVEAVGEEDTRRIAKGKPDFSLFKVLYDEPGMSKADLFKRLYELDGDPEKKDLSQEERFAPLYDDGGKGAEPEPHVPAEPEPGIIEDSFEADARDAELDQVAEQARKEGYDQGFERGRKDGYDKGFDQGGAEGEQQGREKGEQEGYAAGAEQGEKKARELGDEQARELISSLETILIKTEGTWENLVKRYEGKMIALVSRIAEKVVQAKVEIDKGIVRESIVSALEFLPEPEEIVLHVSEEDYEYIEMIKEEFFGKIKSLSSISIVANSGVNRGGCKIESATARVETDVETRLQAVFDAIVAQGDR